MVGGKIHRQWTGSTPYSGINHALSAEGLSAEIKEKLITTKLQSIAVERRWG